MHKNLVGAIIGATATIGGAIFLSATTGDLPYSSELQEITQQMNSITNSSVETLLSDDGILRDTYFSLKDQYNQIINDPIYLIAQETNNKNKTIGMISLVGGAAIVAYNYYRGIKMGRK